MADRDEELFSQYPSKARNIKENEPEYQPQFEDITQETDGFGDISEVYRTADNVHHQKRKKSRFSDFALLLRRIVPVSGENGLRPRVQLELQSDTLREVFRGLAKKRVNLNLHQSPIIIPEPYVELYHCKDAIAEALANDQGLAESVREEMHLLQAFQHEHMAQTLLDLDAFLHGGIILFELIPFIFMPGSLVIVPNRLISTSEVYWCALVERCQIITKDGNKYWVVSLVYTNYSNNSFNSFSTELRWPSFVGIKGIIDLPVYPLRFCPSSNALFKALVQRGSRFRDLCTGALRTQGGQKPHEAKGSHCQYDGPFWEVSEDHSGRHVQGEKKVLKAFRSPPSSQMISRIVVDPIGFTEEGPGFRDEIRREVSGPASLLREPKADSDVARPKAFDPQRRYGEGSLTPASHEAPVDLTDWQLATLPPIIAGFSLSRPCWGFYLVDKIANIKWSKNAYESLQMDQQKKDLVRRIVSQHRVAPVGLDDVILGKGRGLIFLLHGLPGSGKTMTAETVAESLQCPLYYTTSGELGLSPGEIERKLRLIFQRIQRWSAILLFDEADIFMAQRTENNPERNALVSILLRVLEYQTGILFLTTNRLKDLDSAFFSRIHISIAFERPDKQRRTFIWRRLAGQMGHCISDDEFDSLGALDIDGRRIKNVLNIASLLTRERTAEHMTMEDVEDALQIPAGDLSNGIREGKIVKFSSQ